MAEVIHILLTRKEWEELEQLWKDLKLPHEERSYEQYLADEEKNPTMALFG